MYRNPLLDMWQERRTTFGVTCVIPSAVSAEMVAGLGFDYVCVDLQHGAIEYSAALGMVQGVRAAGALPICRVPSNDAEQIMKVLDAGALGVVVPMVSTAEEAAYAVAACRYPPNGVRSFGPVLASLVTGSREPADLERVACVVMIETAEGLENADEIAATPGLDGIFVGPVDLALALGLPPTYEEPEGEHADAVERIRRACGEHGIVAGIQCDGGHRAARRRQQGFGMVTIAHDAAFLRSAASLALDQAAG